MLVVFQIVFSQLSLSRQRDQGFSTDVGVLIGPRDGRFTWDVMTLMIVLSDVKVHYQAGAIIEIASKEYLNMKYRETKLPKSPKHIKNNFFTQPEGTKGRGNQQNSIAHLAIPLQKHKSNRVKNSPKAENYSEGKQTKRKTPLKKTSNEVNSTLIATIGLESREFLKENTQTATPKVKGKNYGKKTGKSVKDRPQHTAQILFSSTLVDNSRSKSKIDLTQRLKEQDYLFIGSEMYPVDNLCPTKRLLNTFREICEGQGSSKFVAQDRTDRPKQKLDLTKSNIFSAARKELEMKKKQKCASMIQRWWRKVRRDSSKHDSYDQAQTERKFKIIRQVECSTPKANKFPSPFEVSSNAGQCSPKSPLAICPAERVEYRPKAVHFRREEEAVMPAYHLPQTEVSPVQNEAVFNNQYPISFHPDCQSEDSFSSSEPQVSPIKPTEAPDEIVVKKVAKSAVWQAEKQMDLLKEFEEATRVKEAIDVRIATQKGILRTAQTSTQKVGISTSTLSIHSFLVRFFQFYIDRHRNEFISLINMPVGHSVPTRLKALQGHNPPAEPEEDEEGVLFGVDQIIDEQKLEEYYRDLELQENSGNNAFLRANHQLEHIHSRAVLEYFNKELNQFRPYCHINGVPYPWNNSHKALTFYFVTDDNIPEVFEKAEIKLLRSTAHLCGLQLPTAPRSSPSQVQTLIDQYHSSLHPLLQEHEESKETKLCHEAVKEEEFEADCEWHSGLMIQLGKQVVERLLEQATIQLRMLTLGIY